MDSIVTGRLRLDAVTPASADALWRLMQAPNLREFQDVPRFTREEFARRVAQRPKHFHARALGRFEWLVTLTEKRRPIGWVSLRVGEQPRNAAEIGYSVLARYRGQGYATEAVGALVGAAFERSELARVEACCVPGNGASRRVLERIGFAFTKMQKDAAVVRGHAVDVVVYDLTRERWPLRSVGLGEFDRDAGVAKSEVPPGLAAQIGGERLANDRDG
jgi:RimJ/RimL family protein N-acetyltransferase